MNIDEQPLMLSTTGTGVPSGELSGNSKQKYIHSTQELTHVLHIIDMSMYPDDECDNTHDGGKDKQGYKL